MAHLIIGHTTHSTARIWVHEDKGGPCHVSVASTGNTASRSIELEKDRDYTGIADFDGLSPGTEYIVSVKFRHGIASGRFRTMAAPSGDAALPFSFVLSSCNLPVVRVNHLLSFLLVMAGAGAARSSFTLPRDRWTLPWKLPNWLVPPLAFVGRKALGLAAVVLSIGTEARQPSPPYLRSPFLKLSAVFDAWLVDLAAAETDRLPVVGDVVTAGAARATIASLTKTKVPKTKPERATCRLVLTHVNGTFAPGQQMFVQGRSTAPFAVVCVNRARPWYQEPSFFIHAGDQIYSDFPFPDRPPKAAEYRRAYHEAWFDDPSARDVLSRWPHYMTLDDHEIADQYALDFNPPRDNVDANRYRAEALGPYRMYVASRNPPCARGELANGEGPFWFEFEYGRAKFFVLDTRTHRKNKDDKKGKAQMVDGDQLCALLSWMTEHREDLKFVITSVPFVAEFDQEKVEAGRRWEDQNRRNPENDKWSASQFGWQRGRIIEHIYRENVEHLVFLTGDMHCCYHAAMRIGGGSKYDSITVHELAGGPLNQLQLPNLAEFRTRRRKCTVDADGSTGIDYEVTLERFHSQVSAVMHLKVAYVDQEPLRRSDTPKRPTLEWNVIRTVTDVGASGWSVQTSKGPETSAGESALGGRIDFVARRAFCQLHPW